jgi:hypothetical protein
MGAGRGATVLPGQGGHVDEAAIAGRAHRRTEHLATQEGAAQVDRQHRVELFRGDLHHRRGGRDGGVVDRHVQPAPALARGGQGGLEGGLLHHVQGQWQNRVAARI